MVCLLKKRLFITVFALLCAFSFANSRKENLLKASYANLSYKKAVLYADLCEIPVEERTEKQAKKLFKLEQKIEKSSVKLEVLKDLDKDSYEEKKEKICAKVEQLEEKNAAIEAYKEYVYHDELDENIPINPKTGFPEILEKPFVIFDEGITFDMITRLQTQEERSNFVWQDYLIGAYFNVQTVNMKPVNSMIQVSAYYPFFHTFDGMEVVAKQTVLYAFDLFAGPMLQADMWKYVRLNFAGGLHYMYQLSDEWHLHYLGLGALVGMELPVARRWTIVNNGRFTLDYANLGTNNRMSPFDYSWSYNISLGVRYSKKNLNKYAYIHKPVKKADSDSDSDSQSSAE